MNARSLRAALAAAVLLAAACSGPDATERCALCGMRIPEGSGFTTGATNAAGEVVAFDSPKCLLRWLGSEAGRGASAPWVTEYFTRDHISMDDALYVLGSDVEGPMGPDVVPVAPRDRADQFASSHGGRVLDRSELTPEIVEGLFH